MPIQSELLRRIYWHRGIRDEQELDYSLANMLNPESLRNREAATEIMTKAILEGKRIMIVGDYDVDGATATTLGMRVLNAFGARDTRYIVPNRFKHGYGLSKEIAQDILIQNPELVVTVDNGISSIEGVKILKEHGIDVLITDHHLPGENLPEADAILNPNQKGCQFGSKNLSGVGVMFYLLIMVRRALIQNGWFADSGLPPPNLAHYLDLVALGTVADVVPLDRNNRILVSQGLSRIRAEKCCKGILALLEISSRKPEKVDSMDLAFAVAPRLNAAGRLENITIGIECLLADSNEQATEYANRLDQINKKRKDIEKSMKDDALKIIGDLSPSDFIGANNNPELMQKICLYDAKFHQGLNGLIASRMKDLTGLPVVVFSQLEDGNLTGSARSIDGLHIRDLLDRISCQNPELITRFGGHAMAAGLTIQQGQFELFRNAYRKEVEAYLNEHGDVETLETDGMLLAHELTLENAKLIASVTTWGKSFPIPTFFGRFYVQQAYVVGKHHLKLRLAVKDRKAPVDAIVFNIVEEGKKAPPLKEIQAVYRLEINDYRDSTRLQLVIEHFTPL